MAVTAQPIRFASIKKRGTAAMKDNEHSEPRARRCRRCLQIICVCVGFSAPVVFGAIDHTHSHDEDRTPARRAQLTVAQSTSSLPSSSRGIKFRAEWPRTFYLDRSTVIVTATAGSITAAIVIAHGAERLLRRTRRRYPGGQSPLRGSSLRS
jgi:hypothetical protein